MAMATGMVMISEQMIAKVEITRSNTRLTRRRPAVYWGIHCVMIVVPWMERT